MRVASKNSNKNRSPLIRADLMISRKVRAHPTEPRNLVTAIHTSRTPRTDLVRSHKQELDQKRGHRQISQVTRNERKGEKKNQTNHVSKADLKPEKEEFAGLMRTRRSRKE
ncbi:hypothetical protein L2E82_10897 [Cichorium intybus]|uniref:Uncharacterized protein n=1 Tax=Cichorium intybus TaxID=13427 RepID=A0ACB9GBT5_CICIN|nr:hypothetical protein L2E82_10897 [Cichorium intybus]